MIGSLGGLAAAIVARARAGNIGGEVVVRRSGKCGTEEKPLAVPEVTLESPGLLQPVHFSSDEGGPAEEQHSVDLAQANDAGPSPKIDRTSYSNIV
jgi:hypothetical protein